MDGFAFGEGGRTLLREASNMAQRLVWHGRTVGKIQEARRDPRTPVVFLPTSPWRARGAQGGMGWFSPEVDFKSSLCPLHLMAKRINGARSQARPLTKKKANPARPARFHPVDLFAPVVRLVSWCSLMAPPPFMPTDRAATPLVRHRFLERYGAVLEAGVMLVLWTGCRQAFPYWINAANAMIEARNVRLRDLEHPTAPLENMGSG